MNVKLVAEIGCNHKGNLDLAKEMIRVAAVVCKADAVKFQKRCNAELLSEREYNAPHPVPENSYGSTYGAHREFLEFSYEDHLQLKKECDLLNVDYSCSVWDLTSARQIAALCPKFIKIPSATNQHYALQEFLCEEFEGEIHVSTGMTTFDEIEKLICFYEKKKRAHDLVVYACTSGYPVKFEDLCLFEIIKLQKHYYNRVKAFGFSGHHLGIAADIAAMALGINSEKNQGHGSFQYIERHFTLDRTWKGTDHAASLEPDGLRRLARDIHNIRLALNFKEEEILEVEKVQRDKLKWGQ